MILHGTRPHTFGIGILPIDERIVLLIAKISKGLCTVFPVHEVFRLHDSGTRQQTHGGANHIIGITHTNHIWVGDISKDNRILILSITLVALRPCYDSYQKNCPYEKESFHINYLITFLPLMMWMEWPLFAPFV